MGMTNQPLVLQPDTDHPITVAPATERIRVSLHGHVITDTTRALRLQESTYPAAFYVPLDDIDHSLLSRSDTTSYCPYKGDATYFSVVTPDGEATDAVWEYQAPYDAVAAIKGHVAFYPNRVEIAVD
jgi:uncharacterized protein (DUF427 family)